MAAAATAGLTMTTPYSLWRTAVLGAIVLATAATVTGLMPLAHAACGDEWGACRANLTHAVFGTTVLPSRATPDFTHQPAVNNTNNMTVLTWTIAQPGGPTLNATVFHTLNTSGSAAGNYPCADPHPPIYPHGYGDTLVLYHNGHETSACVPNYDGVADYFNQLGLDVMEFDMPLIGCNRFANETTTSHQWFQQFEDKGVYTMPYFVEPVILSINYATQVLGYKRIVMVGLSGGGWTTTLAAALDPRIQLSFPIAGSIPFWMRTAKFGDIGDYEQLVQRPMYAAANYTDMYVLGALESGRAQIQILHEVSFVLSEGV